MTRVLESENCGNSPKKLFAQKITVALATGDRGFILSSVVDGVIWNIIDKRCFQGQSALVGALDEFQNDPVEEFQIEHVVTHGKAGAVNGKKLYSSGLKEAFCDVFEFTGASGSSIYKITSYCLQID